MPGKHMMKISGNTDTNMQPPYLGEIFCLKPGVGHFRQRKPGPTSLLPLMLKEVSGRLFVPFPTEPQYKKAFALPLQREIVHSKTAAIGTNVHSAIGHIPPSFADSRNSLAIYGNPSSLGNPSNLGSPSNLQNLTLSVEATPRNSIITMGLPTPVIVDKLKPFIQGYKYCDYIIVGFSTGFDICHNGEVQLKNEQNSKRLSVKDNIVGRKILEEIAKGRIAGPFNEPPFQNLHCSPLFLVPKKSGDFRLIHNLFAPVGHSVNNGISKSDSSVQYQNLSHAIQIVKKLGRGCSLAKVDIESAFRIIPLNKSHYHLLGFTWKEFFYFDRCLAMGAASSCSIFEKFSTSLHWAMENIGHKNIVHILDDFLFVGPSNAPHCLNSLLAFQNMCSICGIPLKDAKTVGPCTTLEFLGATIDTIAMEVR